MTENNRKSSSTLDTPTNYKSLYTIESATVITNPIGSLESLWSYSTKRQRHSCNIKQQELFFIPNGNKLLGLPKTTLPIVFNNRSLTDSRPNQTTLK